MRLSNFPGGSEVLIRKCWLRPSVHNVCYYCTITREKEWEGKRCRDKNWRKGHHDDSVTLPQWSSTDKRETMISSVIRLPMSRWLQKQTKLILQSQAVSVRKMHRVVRRVSLKENKNMWCVVRPVPRSHYFGQGCQTNNCRGPHCSSRMIGKHKECLQLTIV